MGIHAEIYRAGYDCEINRFYGKQMVTVVNAPGPYEPSDDAPAVLIVEGNLPGTLKAVAAGEDPANGGGSWIEMRPHDMIGPMMGGTYVACSDSRFGELCERILTASVAGGPFESPAKRVRFYGAVSLHDRFETPERYEALSR